MKKLFPGLVGFALIAACSASDPVAAGDANVTSVDVGGAAGNNFAPPSVTIKVGQTVRWTWIGGTHNVVSGTGCAGDDGNFRSGVPVAGGSFDHVFEKAGTFPYYCEAHCGNMKGQVIVQ